MNKHQAVPIGDWSLGLTRAESIHQHTRDSGLLTSWAGLCAGHSPDIQLLTQKFPVTGQ